MAGFLHYCFIVDKSHINEAVLSKLLVELCELVGSTPNKFGSYDKEPPHKYLELTVKEAVKELLEDGGIYIKVPFEDTEKVRAIAKHLNAYFHMPYPSKISEDYRKR